MKRWYYLLIVASAFALLLNTAFYLNIGISRKYEVQHPMTTFGVDKDLISTEQRLDRQQDLSLVIYCIILAILVISIYKVIYPHSDQSSGPTVK